MAVAAGYDFTILLRTDGQAVACGDNSSGQCDVPELKLNRYVQVFGGADLGVLLQGNRKARVCGSWRYGPERHEPGKLEPPKLDEEVTIHASACAANHVVFLQTDGKAIACGDNSYWQCDIPALEENVMYTQVAVGDRHTVLLRSDGKIAVCGEAEFGADKIPELEGGLTYTHIAAGPSYTILLMSNGKAVACGPNPRGQCDIPALDKGAAFVQVAAGVAHNVFLQSNGIAKAAGVNDQGQCNIPPLVGDLTYTEIAAGMHHSVLLRSDGQVVTCGENTNGQCSIPALPDGVSFGHSLKKLVQISFKATSESLLCDCSALSGDVLGSIPCSMDMSLASLQQRIGTRLHIPFVLLHLLLPDGKLLSELSPATPLSAVAMVETDAVVAKPQVNKNALLSAFGTLHFNEVGVVDEADLAALFKMLDPDVCTDEWLSKVLPLIDTNQDGFIQYDELMHWATSG